MAKKYYWCSMEMEPQYCNCQNCKYGKMPDQCKNQYVFYQDALKWVDAKREVQGLELISSDFDLMKKHLSEKELIDKNETQEIKRSEQIKQEAMHNVSLSLRKPHTEKRDVSIGVITCLILGFPASYIGQILQLFTMFAFDVITGLFSSGHNSEVWSESFNDSFFYADFWSRYFYWTSLMLMVWILMCNDNMNNDEKLENPIVILSIALFIISSIINVNLLISTIIGSLFIVFGLFVTAKRR